MFEEYALLDAEKKRISERQDEIKALIIEEMKGRGIDKQSHALGNFSLVQLKDWTYPSHVLDIGEEFKTAKAKAESTGEATYETKPSMRFTALKL